MTKYLHVMLLSLVMSIASLSVSAASLQQITSFGENSTNLEMHLYVPDNLPNSAPVVLAVHYCGGSGPVFFQHTRFNNLADELGFIAVYPSVTRSSKCFDVYSPAALTRDGGSDPTVLRNMINYVKSNYNVDDRRIFVTGMSSGAMTTNVMLALYPDVFAAGAAFAGVPYTCFATTGTSEWNSQCSSGQVSHTGQEWGDRVRDAYPGYSGPRPRMQLWHGSADETLHYNNFEEAIKQWTNVHGLSQTPIYTDYPSANATRTRYGDTGDLASVEAISLDGTGHGLPMNEDEVIRFFGLNSDSPMPPPLSSSSSSVSVSSQSSSLSSVSSSNASSQGASDCEDMCQWYQDQPRPLCQNQDAGWGWENQKSCIGRVTCDSQTGSGGILNSCNSSTAESSSSIGISSLASSSSSEIMTPSSAAESSFSSVESARHPAHPRKV